jgi:hypothetical protein
LFFQIRGVSLCKFVTCFLCTQIDWICIYLCVMYICGLENWD